MSEEVTMTKEQAIDKLQDFIRENELDSYFATYKGNLFLVMEGWKEHDKMEEFLGMDLETALDYECGFCDEYTTCCGCGCVIRTSPDSYSWTADFAILDDGIYCEDCYDHDEYLEKIVNNPNNANTLISEEELIERGFEKLEQDYAHGWYGQVDDPKTIYNNLSEKYDEILFMITSQGQFETSFCVFVKNYDESEEE